MHKQENSLEFDVYYVGSGSKVWKYFAKHHYMSQGYNGHHAWIFVLDEPVGFSSIMANPNRYIDNAWREHRTVILPQFQGLGLGARASDWTAHYVSEVLTNGLGTYYSRTVHPRLGEYRERSPLWVPTKHNQVKWIGGVSDRGFGKHTRISYSHKYVGHKNFDEQLDKH